MIYLKLTQFLQWRRGQHNVENLKLSRDCHENSKTHPKGIMFSYITWVIYVRNLSNALHTYP